MAHTASAAEIGDRIRAQVKPCEISVRLVDGDAILNGFVPSVEDRVRAETIARGVDGVVGVRNELAVAPAEAGGPMDQVYEAGVESFPASDPPAWTRTATQGTGPRRD